ncbi:MAG: hypothetical protein HYT79_10555 [Elusimicrobia bacterium]|nr:hypothetical protein [Elusimicrobiota bacterium]
MNKQGMASIAILSLVVLGQAAAASTSTDTAHPLDYYHDWYKDYFYQADMGRTFAFKVLAFRPDNTVLAVSFPEWLFWKPMQPPPSGLMLTPAAYRRIPLYDSDASASSKLLPVNVDILASYYIGRLYSYNRLEELTSTRRSLFSRIGVMFWQVDAKVILEREGPLLPELAVGMESSMMLNNAPAPSVSAAPGVTLTTKEKNRTFNGLFLVASKNFGWFNPSLGWVQGDSPSKLIYLSEFLTRDSDAKSGYFGGVVLKLGRRFALKGELIRPVGVKAAPYLINLQVGQALHANFDLAYLAYERGYEVMAHINFRYTFYPATAGKK